MSRSLAHMAVFLCIVTISIAMASAITSPTAADHEPLVSFHELLFAALDAGDVRAVVACFTAASEGEEPILIVPDLQGRPRLFKGREAPAAWTASWLPAGSQFQPRTVITRCQVIEGRAGTVAVVLEFLRSAAISSDCDVPKIRRYRCTSMLQCPQKFTSGGAAWLPEARICHLHISLATDGESLMRVDKE